MAMETKAEREGREAQEAPQTAIEFFVPFFFSAPVLLIFNSWAGHVLEACRRGDMNGRSVKIPISFDMEKLAA